MRSKDDCQHSIGIEKKIISAGKILWSTSAQKANFALKSRQPA